MIIPCYKHGMIEQLSSTIGVQLVTCKLGTYAELWSFKHNRPVINGKLFLIDNTGRLVLFTDVNPKLIERVGKNNRTKASRRW